VSLLCSVASGDASGWHRERLLQCCSDAQRTNRFLDTKSAASQACCLEEMQTNKIYARIENSKRAPISGGSFTMYLQSIPKPAVKFPQQATFSGSWHVHNLFTRDLASQLES